MTSSTRLYDPIWATRFFRVLSQVDLVFKRHRSRFRGKTSLVNFSGYVRPGPRLVLGSRRRAPVNAGVIARRGGDAEVILHRLLAGQRAGPGADLFGYAYPASAGIEKRARAARWRPLGSAIREFLLPYDDVRRAASPRQRSSHSVTVFTRQALALVAGRA